MDTQLTPHRAIRLWETAAKAALLDAETIAATKKAMVAEVNAYIQRKRDSEQETSVRHTALRQAAKEEPTQHAGRSRVVVVATLCGSRSNKHVSSSDLHRHERAAADEQGHQGNTGDRSLPGPK